MQRKGESLIFTPREQSKFAVGPTVLIQDALDVAEGYLAAAALVDARAVSDQTHDATTHTDAKIRRLRAAQLAGFANAIYELCPDEHLERIVDGGK